jgi:hypothetical protein
MAACLAEGETVIENAAREQRAENQDGGTHGLDHLVGCDGVVEAAAVEDKTIDAIHRDADSHVRQQTQHGRDIVEVRDVGEFHRIGGQQRSAENRQRGILGAGNGDFPG